ncbi:hypothetical protein FA15DRAFT_698772, partial [Coprinopsis marcescibilis]
MSVPKHELSTKIKTKACEVLFPLLTTLNVQAALIGNPGLALLYPVQSASKEVVVAVYHHDPTVDFERLASMVRAKDSSRFSRLPVKKRSIMKKPVLNFQTNEIPGTDIVGCKIRFMFVNLMVGFTIDLRRRTVVQKFPVMPAPWILFALLEEWATASPGKRTARKKRTKDVVGALRVICDGDPDWAEFTITLASFPYAKDRLAMFEAVEGLDTRTYQELIRRNTNISSASAGRSGRYIPQQSTNSVPFTQIPQTQWLPSSSIRPISPPALNSMLFTQPEAPPAVYQHPNAIKAHPPASRSIPNIPSTVTSTGHPVSPSLPNKPNRAPTSAPEMTKTFTRIISAAHTLLLHLDAWSSSLETEQAVLSAWKSFFKRKNWSDLNAALKSFPNSKEQLDKLQAAFPQNVSRRRLKMIRANTTIASSVGDQNLVDRQPAPAATVNSVPISSSAPPPDPPISVPPPPSKVVTLADPVRDSVLSPPEPGSGPHDHTSTLKIIAWDIVNTLRESGFRCAFFG